MSWNIIEGTSKSKVLAVGLISVLLLSVLSAGCLEEGNQESSQESPEGTFSLFVERINNQDGEGVIELFDTQFLDDDSWEELPKDQEEFEEEMDAMQEAIDNGEMEIESYETEFTFLEDMDEDSSPLNRTESEELMEEVNNSEYFTANVDDICMVKFDWNATVEENSTLEYWDELDEMGETDKAMLIMLEIEDEWYIGFTGLAGILYESIDDIGGGGGSELDQVDGSIEVDLSEEKGSLNVTFGKLKVPASAPLSDLRIFLIGDGGDSVEIDSDYIVDQNNWKDLNEKNEVTEGSKFMIKEEDEDISFPDTPEYIDIVIDNYGSLDTEF